MNRSTLDRLEQKVKRRTRQRWPGVPLFVCSESDGWYVWDDGHNVSGPYSTESDAIDAAEKLAETFDGKTPILTDDMLQ